MQTHVNPAVLVQISRYFCAALARRRAGYPLAIAFLLPINHDNLPDAQPHERKLYDR